MEVLEGKKRRKRGKWIAILLIVAFLLYAAISTIMQQIQISQKSQQLAVVQQQLDDQNLKNDELKAALDVGVTESKEYIVRVARENLDYAAPGEQIFVNISGD